MNNFMADEKCINILIVEDEVVLALALEASLEQMGFNVSAFKTKGCEAIKYVENNIIDIVIMDINLNSEIDGIQTAKYIWEKHKIPIIFLTSYGNNKTINEAMQCEPYAYLIKPYNKKELKASILTSLHKHNFFFAKKKRENECPKNPLIRINNEFSFDCINRKLFNNENEINLTKNEIKFLQAISTKKFFTIAFEEVYTYIWRESLYDLGKLRTLVYRLNKKLGFVLIKSVHDFGYRLEIEEY